eukprot:TRINITY_DN599_c0_g2_i2.p1 TRINITY_DN599_c0_g2~~TRINITY_DN599_c0_g2_i2.p1  ORF type:complete len:242 (-),score=51.58 TRINITY_DN599_c0_g2_i2:51-728(-)
MAEKYHITSYPHNPNVLKIQIAALYGGIKDLEVTKEFKYGVDNKTPEFLKKFPLGKIPALDGPEGPVFESQAILRYIARKGNDSEGLLGKTLYEQAIIDQWCEVVVNYFTPHLYPLVGWAWGYGEYDQQTHEKHVSSMGEAWVWIENQLSHNGKKYLVNDRVTLADILFASVMKNAVAISLDASFRAKFPKTTAYLNELFSLPHFKTVLGEVKLVEKFDPNYRAK